MNHCLLVLSLKITNNKHLALVLYLSSYYWLFIYNRKKVTD